MLPNQATGFTSRPLRIRLQILITDPKVHYPKKLNIIQ